MRIFCILTVDIFRITSKMICNLALNKAGIAVVWVAFLEIFFPAASEGHRRSGGIGGMESARGARNAHGAAGLCPCCNSRKRQHKQVRALVAIGMLFWFVKMVDTRSPTILDQHWRFYILW
jgi:hypothetical protein